MLCPRRYGIPRVAIVTYYLLIDYRNCAPSPNGGLEAQEGGFVSHEKGFLQSIKLLRSVAAFSGFFS